MIDTTTITTTHTTTPGWMPPFRVSVIGGGGMVGATTAYAMLLRGLPAEIVIVDVVEAAARGQALDIADASFDASGMCRYGTFADAGQSDLVVISAGYPQKPGETRAQLLGKNKAIIHSIIGQMQPIRKDLKILVVANPVDVLTHIAQEASGLPKNQVFGSGTFLDSNRLRGELALRARVHPSSIEAFVLGEHGDRQFVAWSQATIGGQKLLSLPEFKDANLDGIMEEVMRKAYTIIDAKRSTYYGVAGAVAAIAESVLFNKNAIFPVTHFSAEYGAYISWPCVVGSNGVGMTYNIQLDNSEKKRLDIAVSAIKEMVDEARAI